MCGVHCKLIKAHIIPQSLCPHKAADVDNTKLYSRLPEAFPKKSPIGVYDGTMLCAKCEDLFRDCDDHAQTILRARPYNERPDYFTLRNFNYPLLKRFFIGMLWRASVSSHDFYSCVDVGSKHVERLRELILTNNPGEPEEYAVWLTSFDDPEIRAVMLQPIRQRIRPEGVNIYRFVVAGFTIFIKVDQRPTPLLYRGLLLRANAEVPVPVRTWKSSREHQDVLRVVATAKGP
jgi:hypothetical protein